MAPVVTVPGFGDGSVKPIPAPNWSQIIQHLEARRYLPFFITMGDELDVGGTAPPFASKWIDRWGTGRPPPAPNWMSRGILRPPPAHNWFFNEYHRSHLFNKFPFHRRLYKSASVESCLVSKGVLAQRQRYCLLGFMVIALRVLERIGVFYWNWMVCGLCFRFTGPSPSFFWKFEHLVMVRTPAFWFLYPWAWYYSVSTWIVFLSNLTWHSIIGSLVLCAWCF